MSLNFYTIDAANMEGGSTRFKPEQLTARFSLTLRDMRGLLEAGSFIAPHDNVLLANFARVPVIICAEQLLILNISAEATQFSQQLEVLIQDSVLPWELGVLEALLSFANSLFAERYQGLAAEFEGYRFTDHTTLQQNLEQLKQDCSEADGALQSIHGNETLLVRLSFENQKAIKSNQPIVRDTNDIEGPIDPQKLRLRNLATQVQELLQKMRLKILEQDMKLEVQRRYIESFQLKQKILNLGSTAAGVIGQIFGMNLLNPWRVPDGKFYNGSYIPFTVVIILSAFLFVAINWYLMGVTAKYRNFGMTPPKKNRAGQ